MADALRHRGPDDSGVWTDPSAGVALAHRRLAILDISSAGSQPMQSACGRYVTVYNGEIYNHLTLRQQLESEGRAPLWRGTADTETLLAAVAAWGLDRALRQCVGMFALALWDRRERVLHLARDRMGEKPLYYGFGSTGFAFASELKALRRLPDFATSIDRDSLKLYMQLGYVPAPRTIYQDVQKLPPGTYITIPLASVGRLPEPIPFWSVLEAARAGLANPIESETEAVEALDSELRMAVSGQMLADVPLGAFLSGGVDSSTIVALMQAQSTRPVETFTVGFDEAGYDEAPYAAAVARYLGTSHHEMRVSAADALDVVSRLPDLYDEPFADSSQIPTFLLCAATRRTVTVALSGDGGDELFGGYNRYLRGEQIWRKLRWLPRPVQAAAASAILAIPSHRWNQLAGLVPGGVSRLGEKAHKVGESMKGLESLEQLFQRVSEIWPSDSGVVLGARSVPAFQDETPKIGLGDAQRRMMLWDSVTYLPDDILTKVDRAAMGVSLETRVPFLDHRVVELSWRLPLHMKIRNGHGKWLLRQVLYKHVPRALIERPKAGFAIPLGEWLRGPLREWAEEHLDEPRLRQEAYLNATAVRKRWDEHLKGRRDWSSSLWTVLMFQTWLKRTRLS